MDSKFEWNRTLTVDWMIALSVFIWAIGMKFWYQSAVIDQLVWLVGPTAKLVGWISEMPFNYIRGLGYMNADQTILINKSCSGVNFLIIIVTFSVAIRLTQAESLLTKKNGWFWIPVMSYLTTVIANTTRIRISIVLTPAKDVVTTWISPDTIHRAEGIFVYLFFIIAYYIFCCNPSGSPKTSSVSIL